MARGEAFHLVITIAMMIQLTRNPGSNKVADQVYHPRQVHLLLNSLQLTSQILIDMKIIELRKNGKIGNNKTLTLLSTDKRWQQISWSCELDMRNTQRRHAGQGVGRSGNNQCDGRVIIEDFCSWWGWPWWWSSWLKSWLSTCSWWGGQRGQQWGRQCQTSSPPPSPLFPPPCDQQALFDSLMSRACQQKDKFAHMRYL